MSTSLFCLTRTYHITTLKCLLNVIIVYFVLRLTDTVIINVNLVLIIPVPQFVLDTRTHFVHAISCKYVTFISFSQSTEIYLFTVLVYIVKLIVLQTFAAFFEKPRSHTRLKTRYQSLTFSEQHPLEPTAAYGGRHKLNNAALNSRELALLSGRKFQRH